jgi:hypothetical protein
MTKRNTAMHGGMSVDGGGPLCRLQRYLALPPPSMMR